MIKKGLENQRKNLQQLELKNEKTLRISKNKILERAKGITLIALIITIVLNSSYLAMARMNKFEKI